MELDKEQQRAIECVLEKQVTVITGGPGTGKTTICKEIINRLVERGITVACAAPTGKASKRLQEQTERPASTIHRLLEWSFEKHWFKRDRHYPLDEGAVLIDEASMLDTELTHAVLDAMKLHAKLILVGDVDQLPSIGAGNVLRDIISSEMVPVVRLVEVHRQSENSWIRHNAHRINKGEQIHIDNKNNEDFFFIERSDALVAAQEIIKLVTQTIQVKHEKIIPIQHIQVLCPQKKTHIGVEELNPQLQAILNPASADKAEWEMGNDTVFREGDRVIHTQNDYDLHVFNGEVGFIDKIDQIEKRLTVDFGDRKVEYERHDAMQLNLCYAITIHKSQGSEYPCVVVVNHSSNWRMLGRTLLYTAVTRAQKLVYIVGDRRALDRAIQNNKIVQRNTSLRERLVRRMAH